VDIMDVDKVVILPGTIILKVLEIHECRRIKSMREYYVKGKRVGIANVTEEDCKLSYENLKEDKEMLQENFSYNFDSNIINFEDYKNSHFERRGNIYRGFSIIRLEDSNVIGRVFGLIYEYNKFCLSFYLYNKYRNNGYGSEALELLRKYFFRRSKF